MTSSEIQLLICGAAIGAHGMNIFHMVLDNRAARRSAAAARRIRRISAADWYMSSLHLYQLQHRSPV